MNHSPFFPEMPLQKQEQQGTRIHCENTGNSNMVSAYQNGETIMGGRTYRGSWLLFPGKTPEPWAIRSFGDLKFDNLVTLKKYKPDIVLLGTGRKTKQLPDKWVFALLDNGIIIECMNNMTACGTYNLMLTEERKALLALLAEEIT